MKYMTFNSSCSYAGVANMLEHYGIDVEDRGIALGMGLPYLFHLKKTETGQNKLCNQNEHFGSVCSGEYLAGPMLQAAEWFNLYLKPKGFRMMESRLPREEVFSFLQDTVPAMLGISVSPKRKHAVVCTGMEGERCRFLNNKSKTSSEPESIMFTRRELYMRLDDFAVVAALREIPSETVDRKPYYDNSVSVLLRLKQDIRDFCSIEQSSEALKEAQEPLFRAILLDGITMLELLGKPDPWSDLKSIQGKYMEALKEGRPLVLAERLPMEDFGKAIDTYIELILSSRK